MVFHPPPPFRTYAMAANPIRQGEGHRKRVADKTAGPWTRWRTHSRPARAIRFMETYCRLPKGYGAGQPIKLAEFQKDWIEESLADGVNSSAMSVGRRSCLAGAGARRSHGGAARV